MQPLVPIGQDEASRLAMENELLRYEVRHLRSLVQEAKGERTGRKGGKRKDEPAVASPLPESGMSIRNQQAYDDLVWLLTRLNSSPVGAGLRRVKGFRTLVERYLDGGTA